MRVHISLDVQDLQRSLAFYSTLFGQPASKQRPDYANYRLDRPPIHLALQQSASSSGQGHGHLGVELPDPAELAAWRQRLQAAGVRFSAENDAHCCYATGDKLWLGDPDGHRWEIWVRTGDHEAKGASRPLPTAAVCCPE